MSETMTNINFGTEHLNNNGDGQQIYEGATVIPIIIPRYLRGLDVPFPISCIGDFIVQYPKNIRSMGYYSQKKIKPHLVACFFFIL
jgi:hypothetical protein